jgi:hypothetical protein
VLSCLACGCDATGALAVEVANARVPLNGALQILVTGGQLDPLSVTPRSVRVTDADGQALEHVTSIHGNTLDVYIVIDEALWEAPPRVVQINVSGYPSPHALRDRSGARLEHPDTLTFELQPSMDADHAPRLVSVAGHAIAPGLEVSFSRRLQLVFEGAIDPDSVEPAACPLAQRRAGLNLSPVLPDCSWRLVGDRFELELDVGETLGDLRLSTRELGLRGCNGEAPVPNIRIDLESVR